MPRDLLGDFSNAVAAYLNVTAALADCLEQACPDVGGPYRQRIQRLRSRVAFDATREAIKDSAQTLEAELKDYAIVANRVMTQKSVELESGILALSDAIEGLAQRQDRFGHRLRELAAQMESDRDGVMTQRGAELTGLVDVMTGEVTSIVTQLREQMVELDQQLVGAASTDPVTGLVNRRELERQIDAHRMHGTTFAVLVFALSGPIGDQVLRMAAAKLMTKFRHTDWIGRWGEKHIAVVFRGEQKIAEVRADEAVLLLEGRYTLDNGESVLIAAEAQLLQPELASV